MLWLCFFVIMSGGSPEDQLGGNMDDLVCLGGIGHPLQQKVCDLPAQRQLVHIEGGEQGRDLPGLGVIVKAYYLHILGDMYLPAF